VFVQREADRIVGWLTNIAREPEAWQRASFVGGATLPVTVTELREIAEQLRAVIDPYVQRLTDPTTRPDGARFVRILLGGTPLSHLDEEHLNDQGMDQST
jgi:hypothetical protein